MAEKITNRSSSVRRGDFHSHSRSNHRDNASANDRRHDYEASDIPSWDTSKSANDMRAFATWKRNNPMRYEDVNNMTGNAEEWFIDNGGDAGEDWGEDGDLPKIIEVGLGLCFMSLLVGVPTGIIAGIAMYLLPDQFGVHHWSLDVIGAIVGIIALFAILGLVLGIAITIIGAPFVLLRLLFKLLAMPFRSAQQKKEAHAARLRRKKEKERNKATRARVLLDRKNNRFWRRKRPMK